MTDQVSRDASHPLRHLAIIMDGNNRWATLRGLSGIAGHEAGVERIRGILKATKAHGIEVVSLFAFSSENWQRPETEVTGLMLLFASYLKKEAMSLRDDGVRLKVIGNRANFSDSLRRLIGEAETITASGSFTLVLCVDYGGRWDVVEAAREVAMQVQMGRLRVSDICEKTLAKNLQLHDLPDPDLCIRTGGEERISNFLLWHLAYTELFVSDCYWPDFGPELLDQAVAEYYSRKRRFGHRRGDGESATGGGESQNVKT